MRGTLLQISTSSGGLPKRAVPRADVNRQGIVGDWQKNRKYHGGPQQALLIVAAEVVNDLRHEGWPVFYGALGENLTVEGLDYRAWRAGQRFRAGGVLLELTKPRVPCVQWNVYGRGIQKRIFDRGVKALDYGSVHWGESGFYAAVLEAGELAVKDTIESVDQGVSPAAPACEAEAAK